MIKTALTLAVDLLAKRSYGTRELEQKLLRRGFAAEEIQMAIEKLAGRGYLDDTALCLSLFEKLYQTEKYSANMVAHKLLAKGFSQNDVLNAVDIASKESESSIARRLLHKKFAVEQMELSHEAVKFLLNKGFSHETIEKIQCEVNTEFDDEEGTGP